MKKVIKSDNVSIALNEILSQLTYDNLFILVDINTEILCLQKLKSNEILKEAKTLTIPAGDNNKDLDTLRSIWEFLSKNGATRHSLLINLGGGMVTDIGGFAAATFKRGIKCINIPTTLLGAVDAAVGGKTGINFNGLKNEIGAFSSPITVIIDSSFFQSLDKNNLYSGYAEVIKHSLISNEDDWNEVIGFDIASVDYDKLRDITFKSVLVKEHIVEEDPFEHGIRKALNLGHTIGHAFESYSYKIDKPIAHGFAVAWGTICELYLSHKKYHFPIEKLRKTVNYIKTYYTNFPFDCNHYDELLSYMLHDKKNIGKTINFTLLEDIGVIKLDQTASKEEILDAIDFLRENLGLC